MIKKIYVADDEKNIRDVIFSFLSKEGFVVKTFETGDELFMAFQNERPDLVILDVIMPGTDGFVISSRIRKMSNIPIIMVSARDSEIDRITGISLGSDDYLTKPFSPMELVARVKAMFRRIDMDTGSNEAKGNFSFANIRVETVSRDVLIGAEKIELTPTEFLLLIYFIKNNTKAISREELLKNVWKYDFEIDTRATDDVVKRLRKKLILAGASAKIESVWGYGFKLQEIEKKKEEQ